MYISTFPRQVEEKRRHAICIIAGRKQSNEASETDKRSTRQFSFSFGPCMELRMTTISYFDNNEDVRYTDNK